MMAGNFEHLAPVYFIAGDDPYQNEAYAEQLWQAARQQGYHDRLSFDIDSSLTWIHAITHLKTQSLFGTPRFVIFRISELRANTLTEQNIQVFTPPAHTLILIRIYAPIEAPIKKKPWFIDLLKKSKPIFTQATPQHNVSTLIRAFSESSFVKTRSILKALKAAHTEPHYILYALIRYIRTQATLPPPTQRILFTAAQGIDAAIKGSPVLHTPWEALERLCFALTYAKKSTCLDYLF
jgi:DNA polymerase III delta subunit